MDRSTEWPWSWEEEVAWKAELEERDDDFLGELINSAYEDGLTAWRDVLGTVPQEESVQDPASEKYSVTA